MGTLVRMAMTEEPTRIALEVRFDAQPIEGRIYADTGDGIEREFSGWLGLMAAIEAARGQDPRGEDPMADWEIR